MSSDMHQPPGHLQRRLGRAAHQSVFLRSWSAYQDCIRARAARSIVTRAAPWAEWPPASGPKSRGRPKKPKKDKPKSAAPPLTPSGNPLSEWTLDNRKELAAFMVDPQKDDLFDETDFPSLALEEENKDDSFDAQRRAKQHAKWMSQAPVIFDPSVDDPRLRWRGSSVEWITEEPRYQGIEEEAREWLWELEVESQRAEAMRLHQKHRELGASHFGLANAMGSYMQNLEEADVKDKAEEFAIPSWIRANIEIEKNWDKFERVQQQAEGGAELVQSWQEELEKKGIPDMLSRWAPELLQGEKEAPRLSSELDATYLDGILPGADEEPEVGEVVYEPAGLEREDTGFSASDQALSYMGFDDYYEGDGAFTPAVDREGPEDWDEENDPLGDALEPRLESDGGALHDLDADDM